LFAHETKRYFELIRNKPIFVRRRFRKCFSPLFFAGKLVGFILYDQPFFFSKNKKQKNKKQKTATEKPPPCDAYKCNEETVATIIFKQISEELRFFVCATHYDGLKQQGGKFIVEKSWTLLLKKDEATGDYVMEIPSAE
jgi:hypothetical protein